MNDLIVDDFVSNDVIYNPIAVDDKVGRLIVREQIDAYEKALQDLAGSMTGCMDEINTNGLVEHFAGGAYIRELFIPKDTTIVSKIWNRERMWIITTGDVTFTTEMGRKRVKAPYTEVVAAGSKVALCTHEDTTWFAITGDGGGAHEDIEDDVSASSYDDCVYPWDMLEEKK